MLLFLGWMTVAQRNDAGLAPMVEGASDLQA